MKMTYILIFKIKICFEIPLEGLPLIHLQLGNHSIKIYKDFNQNLYVSMLEIVLGYEFKVQ